MLLAKDISRWQGNYTSTGEPIVFVKISGGDQGLYIDAQAANNYNRVIADGKAFSGYHFAGGTDPRAEAKYFVNAMRPLNPGEVPMLDWEVSNPNPPAWCDAFIEGVRAECGNPNQGGFIYINRATLMAYDWSVPLSKWALFLADWVGQPDANIDTGKYTYTALQYSDGPSYDHDCVYVDSTDQFKKFGWSAPAPTPPTPTPVEPPPTPQPTPEPAPAPIPPSVTASTGPDSTVTITPAPPAPVIQTPVNTNTPDSTDSASTLPSTSTTTHLSTPLSWWARLLAWLKTVITIRKA